MSNTTARTGLLRKSTREVLKLAHPYAMTDDGIKDGIQSKGTAPPPSVVEIRAAIDWNMEKGYVTRTEDDDYDRYVYSLTEKGLEKEQQPTVAE